ncbi:MAG: CHASE2 domain-containing protein [Symploca sp. SIO2E9]|nr:CHASE2 domain-containing protein [Symploca sp. SIO2E9]
MSGQLVKLTSQKSPRNSKLKKHSKSQDLAQTRLSKVLSRLKSIGVSVLTSPALVASVTVTGLLLLGGRQLNLWESWELSAFDKMIQLRPPLPPDPRLLVVEVTEADIQSLKQWPMTDAVMNQVLKNLAQHEPAVIGLDIFRDFSQPPGEQELSETMANNDSIIPVCKIESGNDPGVPPPPYVPEERVGFADISPDADGVIRRGLLFQGPEPIYPCTTIFSLSFQLAAGYLAQQEGIEPQPTDQGFLKLGKVVFKPLSPTSGSYQRGDTGGYQILLNYRSADSLASSITLTDVLNNQIEPDWVKDHIVLIGAKASSLKDSFLTPFSASEGGTRMPGVEVHGQLISQILSAVLDGRKLFWFWPDWVEGLWIWGWSLTGGIVVLIFRHPAKQLLAGIVTLGLLLGISGVVFLNSGWIPVATPALGLLAAGAGVVTYSAYKSEIERREAEQERLLAEEKRQYIEEKVREQADDIMQLQALLKEQTNETLLAETQPLPNGTTELAPDAPTEVVPANYQKAPEQIIDSKTDPNLLGGRYKLKRALGAGGFGLTHLAEDNQLPHSPQCVVKQLLPARNDEKFLKVARRLFQTEAEILQQLGKHDQIPQLMAYFEENQQFYLVQEYIQGHPLSDELTLDKRMPQAQVFEMLTGVLEILVFVHKHSVIHRDIKPGNIMRREKDRKFVLIDFGAVKQIRPLEEAQQRETIAIGSRGYAPPEQYDGRPSFASDIYALGMIGIQALTGIVPYHLSRTEEEEISWRDLAKVSDEFAEIIDKMVRFRAFERYKSAEEVMEHLQKITI